MQDEMKSTIICVINNNIWSIQNNDKLINLCCLFDFFPNCYFFVGFPKKMNKSKLMQNHQQLVWKMEWSLPIIPMIFSYLRNHDECPFKIITYNRHLAQGLLDLLGLCSLERMQSLLQRGSAAVFCLRLLTISLCWAHFTHISVHRISYGIYTNNNAAIYSIRLLPAQLKRNMREQFSRQALSNPVASYAKEANCKSLCFFSHSSGSSVHCSSDCIFRLSYPFEPIRFHITHQTHGVSITICLDCSCCFRCEKCFYPFH